MSFVHKVSKFSIVIFNCYLAPVTSPYGKNDAEFFNHLISQLYLNIEFDLVYFCGDYNARIGNLKYVVEDIDFDISPRHVIDNVVYGHGEALIDFVKDCKLCILNRRLDTQNDKFTYIFDKCKSVVDYIITPQDCFDKCVLFNVYTMNELSLKYIIYIYLYYINNKGYACVGARQGYNRLLEL
jgi:hypothetical protein